MGDSNRQPLKSRPDRPQLVGDANVSVDVDGLRCYREIHGLERRGDPIDPVWELGLTRAAELFDEFDITATFFIVGRDLEDERRADQATELGAMGHELANHTYDHPYDLRRLSEVEIAYQIGAADRIIADVTGQRPVGFRTPGYNVSNDVLIASRRGGHRYDASVFPCVSYWTAKSAIMSWRQLLGKPSRSDRTDPKALLAPRQPYCPDPIEYWKPAAGPSSYVEIPVAAFAGRSMPIIGTSLHLLAPLGLGRVWTMAHKSFPRFFNLEMHAIDFVDADDLAHVEDVDQLVTHQPDLRISWEKKEKRYRKFFEAMCRDRKMVTLAEATA